MTADDRDQRFSMIQDVRDMYKNIRPEDALECSRMGYDSKQAIHRTYKQSLVRKSAFVDGKLAAMFGVQGTPMSLVGRPYFLTTIEAPKVPALKFARVYKQELLKLTELFPILENYVDAAYTGAVRLLEISGFTIYRDSPFMTKSGDMFYKYSLVSE